MNKKNHAILQFKAGFVPADNVQNASQKSALTDDHVENTKPDERTANWARAVIAGFNEADPTSAPLHRQARSVAGGATVLTEVMPGQCSPDPQVASQPIATFGMFSGEINLGEATLLPAGMITAVTVRPTHKRRGLLRAMMDLNLQQLVDGGIPIALLTASAGGIYGRFGFQPVLDVCKVKVAPKPRFQMKPAVEKRVQAAGKVESVTMEWLLPKMEQIYEPFVRKYRCATTRYSGYYEDYYFADNVDRPDSKYRAVVHINNEGELDGYATYSFKPVSVMSAVLEVREVVAATSDAQLGLWDYLTGIELIEEIEYGIESTDSVVPLAITDPRHFSMSSCYDMLWARILDPIVTLSARPYGMAAKSAGLGVVFRVHDPLGYAAGTFKVKLDESGPKVTETDETPQVDVDVQALAALIFGYSTPTKLASISMITVPKENLGEMNHAGEQHSQPGDEILSLLDDLFAPVGPAGFLAEF